MVDQGVLAIVAFCVKLFELYIAQVDVHEGRGSVKREVLNFHEVSIEFLHVSFTSKLFNLFEQFLFVICLLFCELVQLLDLIREHFLGLLELIFDLFDC